MAKGESPSGSNPANVESFGYRCRTPAEDCHLLSLARFHRFNPMASIGCDECRWNYITLETRAEAQLAERSAGSLERKRRE